ncbi:MAG: histidinol-phosphatase HisJ family protein [Bacillota bacterium]
MIDYHLHTPRCCHASGTLQEYLAEAKNMALSEIGFSDHFPLGLLGYTPRNQVTMKPEELDQYISDVAALKKTSADVKIKLGIEVDYIPGTEDKVKALLEKYSFDYVIGSIHFLGDWDFTHPVYADTYKDRDIDEIYSLYLDLLGRLCRSNLFDIVGHIDVVKKFGYRPENGLEDYWQNIVQILKETGACFELNTAGKDAPVGDFYPDRRLLELACAAGIPVTLGSDAHRPDQVGRFFHEAIALLKAAGYRELTVFEGRVKSSYLI